jgi:hypothetical protein
LEKAKAENELLKMRMKKAVCRLRVKLDRKKMKEK